MHHFCSGIGLLTIVSESHRVKFTDGVITAQYHARIFPSNRRACLDLGPRNFRAIPRAKPSFGDKVVDSAFAVFIAGVPILDRRVFDFGVFKGY